jgi:hypothetical protein
MYIYHIIKTPWNNEKPMSILQPIYQTYLEPHDKGFYHRLYTGVGNNLELLINTVLFSWSGDQSVKLFTFIPLITVHVFVCKHRDKFLCNRWWSFSYIVSDHCKRKYVYMNHCRPVLVTIKSHEEIMLVICL